MILDTVLCEERTIASETKDQITRVDRSTKCVFLLHSASVATQIQPMMATSKPANEN